MNGKDFEIIRRKLDLTQIGLSKEIGISETKIGEIEKGKNTEIKKVYELAILRLQDDFNNKKGEKS